MWGSKGFQDANRDGNPTLKAAGRYSGISRKLSAMLHNSREYIPLMLMFVVYTATYSIFLFLRFDSFQSEYYDLGLFSRALFSAAANPSRIPGLVLPTQGSMIGHTDPFMILFVPFFAISPDPRSLLVVTSIALGASIFPLYFLARQHLASRNMAWLFCGVYMLNPLFNNINRYDFQPIAFGPVLIFTALYFYEKGKPVGFLSSLILINSIQEFMALLTAFMAGSLLIIHVLKARRRRLDASPPQKLGPRILIASAILGIAWFSIAYLLQSFFDPSTSLVNFLAVASSGPDPLGKIFYVFLMVGPLLFIPLLEPVLLIPVLPYLGVVFLASHIAYWTIYFQYGAFTVPFIFYAALAGVLRIYQRLPSLLGLPSPKVLLALLVVANALFSAGYSALSPLSPVTWSHVDNHDQVLASMIALVPVDATVLTQGQIYPHLVNRAELSLYQGNTKLADRVSNLAPRYLIYDTTQSSFYFPPVLYGVNSNTSLPPSELLPEMVSTGNYGLYSAYDGAYVFESNYQGPFFSPGGVVSQPLTFDQSWYGNVTYSLTPFGASMHGGNYPAVLYDTALYVNETSFSLSFQLSESGKYLSGSWAGLILGSKDPTNYSIVNFNYLGGPMYLTSYANGVQKTQLIGSTPPLSSSHQYFYLVVRGGNIQVFLDSRIIGTASADAPIFLGQIGFENFKEDTNIQFLQFTILR